MRLNRIAKSALGSIVLTAILFISPAHAFTVKEVRHSWHDGFSRVVVELSGTVKFVQKRLSGPERLFFDFKQSKLGQHVRKTQSINNGVLRKIRTAQYDRLTVRVVLDLGSYRTYKISQLSNPSRIVVDIYADEIFVHKRRIVIDPGHGGKDPGAVGPRGEKEKDLVLDIARRLKRQLEKETDYEVFLTRNTDTYLSLEQRTQFANRKNADLFVSIHLNANRAKKIRGIETYLLNWSDDVQAQRVAARENRITLKRQREKRSQVGLILASLQLQNKRDESLKLASSIQRFMVSSVDKKYQRIKDLGIKQALFYVLLGAEMPSVLVEASFITNREEVQRLKTPRYREFLARGIAQGVRTYFKESSWEVQQIAKR